MGSLVEQLLSSLDTKHSIARVVKVEQGISVPLLGPQQCT